MAKNGRPSLGPRLADHVDPNVGPQVTIQPMGTARIQIDPQAIAGFLQPFTGRARIVLTAMLHGHTRAMAAVAAGVTDTTVRDWARKDPEFAQAVEAALQIGFGSVIEPELYARAFAGPEDRGSMRALELIVKARSSAYRDKQQGRLDVVHHAMSAGQGMIGGWSDTDSSSNEPDPGPE